ncbi:MAG: hypothetical protein ABF289_15080 [Clostridiales bacterium]
MIKQRKNPNVYIIIAGVVFLFGVIFDKEIISKLFLILLAIVYFLNNWSGKPKLFNELSYEYIRIRNSR